MTAPHQAHRVAPEPNRDYALRSVEPQGVEDGSRGTSWRQIP